MSQLGKSEKKTYAENGVSFAADDSPLYMWIISKFHINKYLFCKKEEGAIAIDNSSNK